MVKHILDVAPKSARVLFENEVVRVILVTMKKGEKIPMHFHNRGLSYSLNAGTIRSTALDGKSGVVNVKEGEAGWTEVDGQETHEVENLGDVLRELSIEFRGP